MPFPDGYVPLSRRHPQGQPWQSSNEKIATHWKEQSAEQSTRAKSSMEGKTITSLNAAYAPTRPTPQPTQPKRTYEESMALAMGLPKNDPLREEAKRAFFGKPTHEQEIERLQTERDAFQEGFDRLAKLIKGE